MPAGTYVITQNAGVWFFSGEETRHKGMAVQVARTESKKTDTAKLTFACKGNHCALRSVEPGGGEAGGYWPAPRRSKSDAEELARIVTIPAILSAE
ncbi:MAG: hypothetical protein C5B51_18815 [Terriglobia bacterium]|nr:MAG: hypothetical protein C5B51_18815 [Terriglobia bacterium]